MTWVTESQMRSSLGCSKTYLISFRSETTLGCVTADRAVVGDPEQSMPPAGHDFLEIRHRQKASTRRRGCSAWAKCLGATGRLRPSPVDANVIIPGQVSRYRPGRPRNTLAEGGPAALVFLLGDMQTPRQTALSSKLCATLDFVGEVALGRDPPPLSSDQLRPDRFSPD
jgi:hypothetical protein